MMTPILRTGLRSLAALGVAACAVAVMGLFELRELINTYNADGVAGAMFEYRLVTQLAPLAVGVAVLLVWAKDTAELLGSLDPSAPGAKTALKRSAIILGLAPILFALGCVIATTVGSLLAPTVADVDAAVFSGSFKDNLLGSDVLRGLGFSLTYAALAAISSSVIGLRAKAKGFEAGDPGRQTIIAAGIGIFILHTIATAQ